MLKFTTFFCALFVSEAIGAALDSSAVDSNADVFRTELVQNITAALTRFDTEYASGYAGLPTVDIEAQISVVTPKLYNNFSLIFKRINESNAEKFEDRELAESCKRVLDWVREYKGFPAHYLFQQIRSDVYRAQYRESLINETHEWITRELNRLNSSASTCEQTKCIEIKNQLSNLDIGEKLHEMSERFNLIRDVLQSAQGFSQNGFESEQKEYEQDVYSYFYYFQNCLNCTYNEKRNPPEDKKKKCEYY